MDIVTRICNSKDIKVTNCNYNGSDIQSNLSLNKLIWIGSKGRRSYKPLKKIEEFMDKVTSECNPEGIQVFNFFV